MASRSNTRTPRQGAARVPVFFWLVLLAAVAGIVAGSTAEVPGNELVPSWALKSAAVYSIEVGLAVFLLGYFVALAVCLAYRGKSLGRIEVLGVSGDLPDPQEQQQGLQEAAEGFLAYQQQTDGQLDKLTDSIDELRDRLANLRERADDRDTTTEARLRALERGNVG